MNQTLLIALIVYIPGIVFLIWELTYPDEKRPDPGPLERIDWYEAKKRYKEFCKEPE